LAKILVVEDHPETLDSLTIWLELSEHTVVVARDGYEALALLQKEKPDLVITDGRLHRLGGIDLIKAIRESLTRLRDVPIIVVTGYYAELAREALMAGANLVVSKPTNPGTLLANIIRLLNPLASGARQTLKPIRSREQLEQLTTQALSLAYGSLNALKAEIALGNPESARQELDYLLEVMDTIDLCLTALALKRQEDIDQTTDA